MSRSLNEGPSSNALSELPRWLFILVVLLLACSALDLVREANRADRFIVDQLSRKTDSLIDEDVVLVAVDERSLSSLGRWPWRRTVHAAMLDQLTRAGVSAVAFNVLFTEPSEVARDDEVFAKAIARNSSVVLGAFADLKSTRPHMRLPVPVLAKAAARIGHTQVEIDEDGVVRSVFLRRKLDETVWSCLALALVEVGGAREMGLAPDDPDAVVGEDRFFGDWTREGSQRFRIPFAQKLPTTAKLSFVDVLEGRMPRAMLQGKLVLVGVDSAGLGDAYPTPLAGSNALMSGLEVHANVVTALLQKTGQREAQSYENFALSATVVLAAVLCLVKLRAKHVPLGLIVLFLAVLAVVFICQEHLRVQMAPSLAIFLLGAVYPLWTWQRLSAAVDYLAAETRRIRGAEDINMEGDGALDSDDLGRSIASLRGGIQALKELRSLVQGGLNGLPDAVLVAKLDGTIVLANEVATRMAQRAGLPVIHDKAVLQVMRVLCPELPELRESQALPSVFHDSATTHLETSSFEGHDLLLKLGRWQGVSEYSGWVISLVDVSGIRTAERQRDEALNFITHDIRAPQTSIMALLELRKIKGPALNADDLFAKIEFHAGRTLSLVNEFIQIARVHGRQVLAEDEIVAWDIVEAASENVRELASLRGMQIMTAYKPELELVVRGDFSMLERALTNLIENAVKYGYEKTRVVCELSVDDKWAVFSVRDRGVGISNSDQARIFQKFVRGHIGAVASSSGHGLGLAYVKAVVARHGGRVRLNSVLGSGSCFEILLPLVSQNVGPLPSVPLQEGQSSVVTLPSRVVPEREVSNSQWG